MHLIGILGMAGAVSALATPLMGRDSPMIPISTFTDQKCDVPSTSAKNVSVPLDSCIITVGMESLMMNSVQCSGGLPKVKAYYFSDTQCAKQDSDVESDISGCAASFIPGDGIAAMLLTCTNTGSNTPKPSGASTTITVGSAVPASTGVSSSSGSGSSSGSSSSSSPSASSSSDSSSSNSFSLGTGAKTGIGIGGGILALLGLFGGSAICNKFVIRNQCTCCPNACQKVLAPSDHHHPNQRSNNHGPANAAPADMNQWQGGPNPKQEPMTYAQPMNDPNGWQGHGGQGPGWQGQGWQGHGWQGHGWQRH